MYKFAKMLYIFLPLFGIMQQSIVLTPLRLQW